jgi:ribosomal protein S18 acetylase RimI-like enzyme
VHEVAVLPEFQRYGIGRMLFEHLVALTPEIPTIALASVPRRDIACSSAFESSLDSTAFYERLGMVRWTMRDSRIVHEDVPAEVSPDAVKTESG